LVEANVRGGFQLFPTNNALKFSKLLMYRVGQ
jgi:hypothetical protein